jgi:hypothetical protein
MAGHHYSYNIEFTMLIAEGRKGFFVQISFGERGTQLMAKSLNRS